MEGGQRACRNDVSWQCILQMCGAATANARLPTVDSLTGGTTRRFALVELNCVGHGVKRESSPYSINERRVPELISVLGS